MQRFRFKVEYIGSQFAGWQIQPEQITVQGELEKAFKTCLREDITVFGAGRTDAGVHALGQVAHFDCKTDLDLRKVERSINALTSDAVCIRDLEPCAPDFHARFSAQSRLYRYRIALRPTALYQAISWYHGYPLDLDLFSASLSQALGQHDFNAFSVPREDGKSTVCNLLQAKIERGSLGGSRVEVSTRTGSISSSSMAEIIDQDFFIITIEADRFLHKMVRSLVGASFDVARGALPFGLIPNILSGNFSGERTWAPAKGLCLEEVKYDQENAKK